MKLFFTILFTISLSFTFMLPAVSLLIDDTNLLSIGNITEEEEKKDVKLGRDIKDYLIVESCFLNYMGLKKEKVSTFNLNIAFNCIYIDVFLPPPERFLFS